jgi:hypothetical protein
LPYVSSSLSSFGQYHNGRTRCLSSGDSFPGPPFGRIAGNTSLPLLQAVIDMKGIVQRLFDVCRVGRPGPPNFSGLIKKIAKDADYEYPKKNPPYFIHLFGV